MDLREDSRRVADWSGSVDRIGELASTLLRRTSERYHLHSFSCFCELFQLPIDAPLQRRALKQANDLQ